MQNWEQNYFQRTLTNPVRMDYYYLRWQKIKISTFSIPIHCVLVWLQDTVSGEEKSVIGFILVCGGLKAHFEYMVIDEDRIHVLKKYCTRKGIRNEIESDHNVQYAKFNLKYQEIRCRTKREIFNFKNTECQQKFYEVTQNTHKLSSCFGPGGNFLDQSSKFFKTLDGTFHQCFKKIRIKNNKKEEVKHRDRPYV